MESPKRFLSEAGEAALILLRFVEASSDAFPPLKSAAAGTLHVVELLKGFNSSKREWGAFGDFVLGAALCAIDAIYTSSEPKDDLEGHAKRLKETFDNIATQIVRMQKDGPLKRFWEHSKAPQRIEGLKQEVREALELFHLKADVVTIQKLREMPNERDMERLLKDMGNKFSKAVVHDIRVHDAVERLPHLLDASWNVDKTCHSGTRATILEEIWQWIQKADPNLSAEICLLADIAGSGKSAFANSISARCDEEGVLFATFFFDQQVDTKARPTYLFSTLAYQLIKLGQDYTDTLGEILSQEPLLYSPDQTRQFQRLILPAAKSAKRSRVPKPIVVIIDALDEGADETTLRVLSELVPSLPGTFRFFVTSRRTPKLDYYLATPAHISHYSLDILGTDNVTDLRQYIEWRLPELATYQRLGTEWVTPQLIGDFANKAEGLFIWAVTVCEYLRDENTFDPKGILQTLLYEKHEFGLPPEQKMAQLFDRILNPCDWSDEKFRQAFQQVLGIIVIAKVPLSSKAMQHFCPGIPVERIFDRLKPLITGLDHPNQPVKFSHLSFSDYLTSRTRAEEAFHINPQMHESRLALLCLKTLTTDFKAGSPGTGYLDNDLEGIPSVPEGSVAQHVSYACRFGVDHCIKIKPEDSMLGVVLAWVASFLASESILQWLEMTTAIGEFVSLRPFRVWHSGICRQTIGNRNDEAIMAHARAIMKLAPRLKYEMRLEEALSASEEAVILYQQLSADHPAAFASDLARSLYSVSIHLSDLGRREEAFTAIQEAVTIRRTLVANNPAAFASDLAKSLNNVSLRLSDLGRREEALTAIQEAVVLCRQLATEHPAAFTSDLAMSLNNVSLRLSDLGRRDEALTAIQDAVMLFRQLATERPATFASDLAQSINNVSLCLSNLGYREESLAAIQEAVALYRQLAANRPAAFASNLANSLHNVSLRLSDLGRRGEALITAQEAVVLHRQLAADRPAAFASDLALSLNNVAARLSDLGCHTEALTAVQEAVILYRQLATVYPAAFASNLAQSVNNVSLRLSALGRRDEALTAIQEAVVLFRQLATERPATFASDLAQSLNSVSLCLSNLGYREESLTAIQEAITLYRPLAADRPAVFASNLAGSLNSMSVHLSGLGRQEEALTASQEAVALYRPLAADRPAVFASALAMSLLNISTSLFGFSRQVDALIAIQEAVALYRQLAADHPAVFASNLAGSLNNASYYLFELGRHEDAVKSVTEAVLMYRQLSDAHPEILNKGLAGALDTLSTCLLNTNPQAALEASEEAIQIYRPLVRDHPKAFNPNFSLLLNNLAECLSSVGRPEEALQAVQEAVSIQRQLVKDLPAAFNPDLAKSLDTLSSCLSKLGREEEAQVALSEASLLRSGDPDY